MTIIRTLIIDGYETHLIGFSLSSPLQDWRDGIWRQWEHTRIPGTISSALLNTDPKSDVRPILLRGAQVATSLALLRTNYNLLLYRLYNPAGIEIIFTDDEAFKYKARMAGRVRVTGLPNNELSSDCHTLEIPLECIDPRMYETALQAVVVTTDTDLPMGTAPVGVEFECSAATFTLTLKDSAAGVVKTITITGAASPPIKIHMENKSILNSLGNSVITTMTGDFPWDVDPLKDGDFITSAWPNATISAGTCTARYNKAHLL